MTETTAGSHLETDHQLLSGYRGVCYGRRTARR
jgi:hypothetical protein